MRLSELVGKEVVNLTDATRIGVVKTAEVMIDTEAGRVEALLVPFSGSGLPWRRPRKLLSIPWRAIRKSGPEMIIVEVKTLSRDDRQRGPVAIRTDG